MPRFPLLEVVRKTPLLRRTLALALLMALLFAGLEVFFVHPAFQRLVVTAAEDDARRVARHLSLMLRADVAGHDSPGAIRENALRGAARDFELWKLKLFDPAGVVVYSTDSADLGKRNTHAYFLHEVARGRSYSEVVKKRSPTLEGEQALLDVAEVYVPVMDGERFLGAFEIYYDLTARMGELDRITSGSRAGVLGLAVGLVLVSLLLVVKAAREQQSLALTQSELRERDAMFRDLVESAGDGIMVTDAAGRIQLTNPAFSEITGFSAEEARGNTPRLLHSGRQNDAFYRRMWESLKAQGRWAGEVWNRRKDGNVYPQRLSISAVRDGTGEIVQYVGIFTDISRQKASEAELRRLAYRDPLTGLSNRLLFFDRLEQAMREARRRGQQVAVLFLDLDGFKEVNDRHGHEAGDRVLQALAGRVQEGLREEDTVARLGGDEFAVVIQGPHDPHELEFIARQILTGISAPIRFGDASFVLGGSIGISRFPTDGDDSDDLVKKADAAMYRAKGQGGNRVAFFSE